MMLVAIAKGVLGEAQPKVYFSSEFIKDKSKN